MSGPLMDRLNLQAQEITRLRRELAAERAAHQRTREELDAWEEEKALAQTELMGLREELAALRVQRCEGDAIFRWLSGEAGEFPDRPDGAGLYWWRKELRRLSPLAGEGANVSQYKRMVDASYSRVVAELAEMKRERDETLMLAEHPDISNLRDIARELVHRGQRIIELEAERDRALAILGHLQCPEGVALPTSLEELASLVMWALEQAEQRSEEE